METPWQVVILESTQKNFKMKKKFGTDVKSNFTVSSSPKMQLWC
jgi:hypothetical protein